VFRRLAAHLVKHQLGIADYREKWGYRRNTPLMTADLLEAKREWAIAKNLAGFAPPGILLKAHEVLRRGRPPVRLETRLNKRDYGRALAARGWRPPNLRVPAQTLRRLVQQGLTRKEIGERTGLRPSNVWRRLRALGLGAAPRRSRPMVDARDAGLLALRQAGLWNAEIAQRTGMKADSVSARFERMRKRGVRVPTPERPVPTPRRRVSDETLLALLRQGLRPAEIAARLEFSISNIHPRLESLRRRGLWPGGVTRKGRRRAGPAKPGSGSSGSAAGRKGARRGRPRRQGSGIRSRAASR
jgi:DNA-binding Lrp family transcriptional regulator